MYLRWIPFLLLWIAQVVSASDSADLLKAIRADDVALVRTIATARPELLNAAPGDISPLLIAALGRRPDGFRAVQDNPVVAALAPLIQQPTPFELAVLGRGDELMQRISKDPTLAETRLPNDWSLLHVAAYCGDPTLVDQLIGIGIPVDARAARAFQVTPLQSALLTRQLPTVKRLLEHGAAPLARFADGSSYLHEAALLGDVEAIRMLAEAGSDPLGIRNNGERPVDVAGSKGHRVAAEVLLALESRALRAMPESQRMPICDDIRAFRSVRPELARHIPQECPSP